MKKNKLGYTGLKILSIILVIAAIATIIPYTSASEVCVLGYRALCSFTPASTIILIVAAQTAFTMKDKFK